MQASESKNVSLLVLNSCTLKFGMDEKGFVQNYMHSLILETVFLTDLV